MAIDKAQAWGATALNLLASPMLPGWFFIGIGNLILLGQFARWLMNVEIEAFWLA